MAALPTKLKDPRTCRVFVSSPFGGLEKEREELVAQYFPQLTALCQAKGVQFVAVDMRWGITEEAANDNQVVNICLQEIDRSDIFVGIYAQRYGWHGKDDAGFQRNIDLAIKKYPWLKTVRDRSVTEFEFLHGHLNKPGTMPAIFAFRDKKYDDNIISKVKDEREKRKLEAESENARKLLNDLKARVKKTKCLAIHDNYQTPEEAAKLLFDNMKAHMVNVLLKDTKAQSPRDLELACHDAYTATHTSFYIGGQAYMKELDQTLSKGGQGHLVTGPEGSGKGALISNWLTNVKKKKSHAIVYHFVGCSKNSTNVTDILQRLIEELEIIAGVQRKKLEEREEEEETKPQADISELFQQLKVAMDKAAKKKKVLIVVDGLSRIEKLSRTTKALFWLPVDLPHKSVTVVVTCRDEDTENITELKERGYITTRMVPLTESQQKEFSVGFLKATGKELSSAQLSSIVGVKQTENPLFLKIVLTELCAFGQFRLLDNKISSLINASSVAELFVHLLTRLEEDYNGRKDKDDNLIQKVLCSMTLTKKGLTETEIRGIVGVPSAAWSPVYFAIKDFLLDHSGLLRLAFEEMQEAVVQRYMPTKKEKDFYLRMVIDYFQKLRKSFSVTMEKGDASVGRVAQELAWLLRALGDKEQLIETLIDPIVFARMFIEDDYELMEMWRCTGRSGEQIAQLYLTSIDKQRQRYLKEVDQSKDSLDHVIDMFVLSHLDALTYFLELNHYANAMQAVLKTRLKILEETMAGKINEIRYKRMLCVVKVKLSYIYAENGHFDEASALLTDVLQFRKEFVEQSKGSDAMTAMKDLAGCYHAIGLLHSKMGNIDSALEYYKKSMEIHSKLDRPLELADSMNNLGVMLMKKGDYELASDLCLKALKIYEAEYFGHLPPIIGVLTANIAVCYRNLNRLDESEKMYKKAMDIAERALGRNHVNVASALTNLGTLEVNRDMYEKAEVYFKEALAIHKNCVTPNCSYDLFTVREKYTYTLIKLKKDEEALELFQTLFNQAVNEDLLPRSWPIVWLEVLSLTTSRGQPAVAAKVAPLMLQAGIKLDPIYTFLDRADRMLKEKAEKRSKEMTVAYALEQNPKSQVLLAYQAQEVLIPDGRTADLLALLDKSDAALKAGSALYHAAMSWCDAHGKKDMATAVLMHAAPKFKEDYNLAGQMASILRDEKKYSEAKPYALALLSGKPNDAHVLLFAGQIILHAGDKAGATEAFNKVLKLCKPSSDEYKQAKSGIEIAKTASK